MRVAKIALVVIGIAGSAAAVVLGADYWMSFLTAQKADARVEDGAARRETPVVLAQSQMATFREMVEAVGTTRAKQSIDLVPLAAGRVERITFQGGEHVDAGQLLVQIDDRSQKVMLKEAEASLVEARSAFERIQDLRERKVSSEAALEQARAAFLRAEAIRDRAQHELADRAVKAPFAGTIGLRKVEEGSRIDTGTVITSLDDLAEVEVEFSVPELYFPRVSLNQPVAVRSDAFPDRTFEGRITAIDSRVSASSRAFKVRATIPNRDMTLRTGMFVGLELVLDERRAPAVPEEAIVSEGDKTFIYSVADGRAQRVAVKLGLRNGGLVEVREGLDAARSVIVSGLQNLEDGMAVKATKTQGEAKPKEGTS